MAYGFRPVSDRVSLTIHRTPVRGVDRTGLESAPRPALPINRTYFPSRVPGDWMGLATDPGSDRWPVRARKPD
jgi:hypothetical protein